MGYTFISKLLENNSYPETLIQVLGLPQVQSIIRSLSPEERTNYLNILTQREFENRRFATVIEWLEAQFGVRRLPRTSSTINIWKLKDIWKEAGTESTKAYMREHTWIGIVTVRGLSCDNIVKTASRYCAKHPETRFAYVTQEMIDALGVESFSGFISPGAGDNFPRRLDVFTLEHMPEERRTETSGYTNTFTNSLNRQAFRLWESVQGLSTWPYTEGLHSRATRPRNRTLSSNPTTFLTS